MWLKGIIRCTENEKYFNVFVSIYYNNEMVVIKSTQNIYSKLCTYTIVAYNKSVSPLWRLD